MTTSRLGTFATLTVVVPVVILAAACGAHTRDADAAGPACRQFESLSGNVSFGDVAAQPTTPSLAPNQPEQGPPPTPPLPSLNSVNFGQTDTGDTVVFNLDGSGSVGWSARFVQTPLRYGTDAPIQISGSCVVQMDLTGVESNHELPLKQSTTRDTSAVVALVSCPSRSAIAQTFIGTRSGSPTVTVESSSERPTITVTVAS
ncbi:hypothetical protein ABH922_001876 [Rhodococcus sp. 27YEA15]|uniref:AMIN-like domain-containing (lipo)protein n=1 Tax=Rhodococcus sp. 27YEA15 TaxID=3156259 RepID=UPI003C7E3DD7